MPQPSPVTPLATELATATRRQLASPAALLLPAPVRTLLGDLAAVVLTLAQRVDDLAARSEFDELRPLITPEEPTL